MQNSQKVAPSPKAGKLHKYSERLVAFEHDSIITPSKHMILFVGGLGDGLGTVAYPAALVKDMPRDWSIVEVELLSSLEGWGCGSLARDVNNIAECVTYFRKLEGPGSKIILMGHSTGCQDAMEYISGVGHASRPRINGVILQAPVSDREAAAQKQKNYDTICRAAQKFIDVGKPDEILHFRITESFFGNVPVTAYRCNSLLSPDKEGDDDYFSSDLSVKRLRQTFGAFTSKTPLLILSSGSDEHVPSHIDVPSLLNRWIKVVESVGGIVDTNSGIIEGAHHNFSQDGPEIMADLCSRVHSFVRYVTSRN